MADIRPRVDAAHDRLAALREVEIVVKSFQSVTPTTEMVAGYAIAIEGLPTWAISEAVRRWLRGDVLEGANLAFPPSPPQLRKMAMEELAKARAALHRAERLLTASVSVPKQASDEMRARTQAILKRHGFAPPESPI